jgi:aspartokinase
MACARGSAVKIALIHYTYAPVVGSVETVMAEHARFFAGQGHDVTIICDQGRSDDPRFRLELLPDAADAAELARALEIVNTFPGMPKFDKAHTDSNVAKVSVIGVGMKSHAGVAADMFKTLAEKNINIIVISTSEIKISVLIDESYIELALRALHTMYGLDAVEETV